MTYIPNCPLPTALAPISAQDCAVTWGQITGFAVQRIDDTNNIFDGTGATPITAETNWNTFAGASDDTKIIYTPFLGSGLTIPKSTANEDGGNDNTTVDGIPLYNGEDNVQPTGVFRDISLTVYNELCALTDESLSTIGRTNIGVYLFTEATDTVVARQIATDIYAPIPIYNFRLSSPGTEGFNARNEQDVTFYLKGDWGKTAATVSGLDFDPHTKLANFS